MHSIHTHDTGKLNNLLTKSTSTVPNTSPSTTPVFGKNPNLGMPRHHPSIHITGIWVSVCRSSVSVSVTQVGKKGGFSFFFLPSHPSKKLGARISTFRDCVYRRWGSMYRIRNERAGGRAGGQVGGWVGGWLSRQAGKARQRRNEK